MLLAALGLATAGLAGSAALAAEEPAAALAVALPVSAPVTAPVEAAATAATGEQALALDPAASAAPEAPALSFTPAGSGVASWYGAAHAGKRTASGERFDPAALTAAHRTLPFGSKVRVTHEGSGRSVVVTINDRGPFSHGRIIDVSEGAAKELGLVRAGSGKVRLELVGG